MPSPSHFVPQRRAAGLWLAMLLLLFSTLAPTLAHALAAKGAPAMEVCTSSGVHGVATLGAMDGTDGQESAPAPMGCCWCSVFTDRALPAHDLRLHWQLGRPTHQTPVAWPVAFLPVDQADPPPPRGPPAHS